MVLSLNLVAVVGDKGNLVEEVKGGDFFGGGLNQRKGCNSTPLSA